MDFGLRTSTFKSVDNVNQLTYKEVEASSSPVRFIDDGTEHGNQSESNSAVPPGLAASLPLK
jgi:hypothetical protein